MKNIPKTWTEELDREISTLPLTEQINFWKRSARGWEQFTKTNLQAIDELREPAAGDNHDA